MGSFSFGSEWNILWQSEVLCGVWYFQNTIGHKIFSRYINQGTCDPLTPHGFHTLSCSEHLYHLWVEAVMGQLSNKGQTAGSRLPHEVFFHSFYGLKVVLQQSAKKHGNGTHINITPYILVCSVFVWDCATWQSFEHENVKQQIHETLLLILRSLFDSIFNLNIFFSTGHAIVRLSHLDLERSIDHWFCVLTTFIKIFKCFFTTVLYFTTTADFILVEFCRLWISKFK